MNLHVVKALFLDALYQVLDNWVFRILAAVVLLMVLSTFLVGARDDSLVLLFGWKEVFYEDFFAFFGLPYPGIESAGETLVQIIQRVLVDGLAGLGGVFLSVAATAFFVPRMLERGAADTLFSKPVSRYVLLLSRYMAGLLFVFLLATVLVGGMQVGFLLNSGYSDPGFLWSILTLTYVFGLLHGVSVLVGVLTRSTVAAILLTVFFWILTGGIHRGWMAKEWFLANEPQLQGEVFTEQELEADAAASTSAAEQEESSPWRDLFFASLDTAHFVLPKTTEASMIARKLRRDLEHRYAELWDEEGGLLITGPPAGWERRAGPEALEGTGMLWALPDGGATMRLTRRSAVGTSRMRSAKALRISLESRPGVVEVSEGRGSVANTQSSRLDWVEETPDGPRNHRAHLFLGGGFLYTLEIEGTPAWDDDEEADDVVQRFVRGFTFNESASATTPGARFENVLDWDAPLRNNILFSILSSLAFLLAVLGLAWWRLARVDF